MKPKFVVVAPTYNNARTLPGVLAGLAALGLPVIAVDDGSTDGTAAALEHWAGETVTHPANRGKAAALRTGFARAAELGYTHAVTIDTDGQHDVADVPALVGLSRDNPDAIVVGARPRGPGYPARSWLGRRASNALVQLIGGARVSDSQSGLRVYPLDVVRALRSRTSRYAFETEILARAGWANVPVVEAAIRCIYDVPAGRVSHFCPGRDSASAVLMHAALLHRSVWPARPAKVHPVNDRTTTGTLWERGVRWANPFRTWRLLREDAAQRERVAASVGWGAFMAFQPFFGLKTVSCLAVSRLFRLQPLVVMGTSSLATPPVGPILWAMSIWLGHLLLGRPLPRYDLAAGPTALFHNLATEWVVGAMAFGVLAGAAAYLATRRAVDAWFDPAPHPSEPAIAAD